MWLHSWLSFFWNSVECDGAQWQAPITHCTFKICSKNGSNFLYTTWGKYGSCSFSRCMMTSIELRVQGLEKKNIGYWGWNWNLSRIYMSLEIGLWWSWVMSSAVYSIWYNKPLRVFCRLRNSRPILGQFHCSSSSGGRAWYRLIEVCFMQFQTPFSQRRADVTAFAALMAFGGAHREVSSIGNQENIKVW